MFDIKKAADQIDAMLRAKGVAEFEFQVSESEKKELNTEGADFNLLRTIFGGEVSVSVILEGRKGSASGNDLSDAGLEKVIGDALLSAQSAEADEANAIAEKQEPETFRAGLLEADMPRFYDCLKALCDAIGREYPKVNLLQVIADHTSEHTIYRNASGTRFESFDGGYHVMVEMSGSDGEKNTGLDYFSLATRDLDTPLIDQGSVRMHLEATEASLNSVPLPGKFEGTVIFTPDCLGYFLYMLASNYVMNSVVMEGTSQWLNRYKAEDVTFIDKGVLKSFLLNLYTARKTGRPVTKNTGFALVMEGGDTPLADMIASVKKGLIVGGFSGGEPGANGEFSGVAKNSFLVEDGNIVGAVTETMINGNLEKVFQDVAAVSKEQVCDGSTVLPYMACTGIVISGNN